MSTPGMKLDRSPIIEEQILAIVRELLNELGSRSAIETCARAGLTAHLERTWALAVSNASSSWFAWTRPSRSTSPIAPFERRHSRRPGGCRPHGRPGQRQPVQPVGRACRAGSSRRARQSDTAWLSSVRDAAESLTEILIARGRANRAPTSHVIRERRSHPSPSPRGELLERASAVGAELTRRGLAPGETVALMLPTGADFSSASQASGWPRNPRSDVPAIPRGPTASWKYAARQEGILRNAEAKFLITFRQVEGLSVHPRPARPLAPRYSRRRRTCAR